MKLRTFSDTGSGPYRVTIRIEEPYYRLVFVASDWNKIKRGSLEAGGNKFITDYLPLRFQQYARAELGYSGMKKNGGLPLVQTGRLRLFVLNSATAKATARSGGGTLTINIPTPEMTNVKAGERSGVARTYAANPLVQLVLSTVTERETGVIDRACQVEMERLITGAEVSTVTNRVGKSGQPLGAQRERMRLGGHERERLTVKHKERKTAA